ncbi:nucleoside-diphosphate-sugar epimerase [Bisporella sp. PMI_857]|nr:nucleoside-diphosphate-sugar epimerase [Bisporella sp. PMI_857]
MSPKIFLTGGTGYIGGSVLVALVQQHPEYEITVLLRRVPPNFRETFLNVKIVEGNFDDVELISATAALNDIVIHNGKSKHEPSIKAHIAGLLRSATPSSPRFLIRLGGTGAIADWADPTYYGKKNPKVWSDINDIDTITSLPDTALHRAIEKIVQTAAMEHGDVLKCAIICSCGVYGQGKGIGRTQSIMVPVTLEDILASPAKQAFYTGSGSNTRSWVHIDDLVSIYLKLVEAAAAGGGTADWGREGYYFTSTQEVSQLSFATATGQILEKHKAIENGEPLALPLEQIKKFGEDEWAYMGYYTYACSTRTSSDRARKVLGYEPKAPPLFDCLEEDFVAAVAGKK